jgi:hypothetical protein
MSVRGVELAAPKRGKGQWGGIRDRLRRMHIDEPTAELSIAPESTSAELLRRAGRSGILVFITDALAPNGDIEAWPRAVARARASGHDVRVVQILSPEDIDPPWDGDLQLVDAESGGTVDITFYAGAREAYAKRLEALVGALREGCRKSKAAYARARSDESVIPVVRRFAGAGID